LFLLGKSIEQVTYIHFYQWLDGYPHHLWQHQYFYEESQVASMTTYASIEEHIRNMVRRVPAGEARPLVVFESHDFSTSANYLKNSDMIPRWPIVWYILKQQDM
jgi:hypothetical protein